MVTDAELVAQLATLHNTLELYRKEAKVREQKTDRRIFLHRIAIAAAFLIALGGVWVGRVGLSAAHEARRATHNLAVEMANSRVAGCQQSNDTARRAVAASDAGFVVLAAALAPTPRTAAMEARVDVFLQKEHAEALIKYPLRDCTPKGITHYLTTTSTEEP